ncbi:tetratricopeptide repeat protein [Flavobacteriaceae bacterium XHP0103]|uniref:tetratricopeptide repeat protein n=1 Tax=Marixanthotalea marina TaxID=2844359 RepID=UPI00298A02EA|nr:tetratricopeptide repeat protein [Marixanthotalea marina]MBU3822340.1 tetratricopeptide repeat protein [Marixanthotalea marina]
MKKQVIIALAISVSAFSFAQKKELKAVEKAIKGSNYAEAKAALQQVEPLMSQMDEKETAQFYYLKAKTLFAGGAGSINDIDLAIENIGKVEGGYETEVAELKQEMANNLLTRGNEFYNKQDYSSSSKFFEKTYRLNKDTIFLYYAASTAVNVPEYDRALTLYEELKGLGYTGIEKEYYATNKETGEEDVLDKTTRDLYVRSGTHSNPGERMTESRKPEIVKNVALIYVSQGNNEKAIAAIQDAKEESPDDINLILSEANIYYKMGDTEKFKSLLQKATDLDPNNAELQYNLGVISGESGDVEGAKKYYKKTIELDPNYINAYINLAVTILDGEKALVDEMNGLGNSAADNKRYDELLEQRKVLYKEAIPHLDQALKIDGENVNAATTLMNIYSVLGETDKYKEMKAKVDSLN